jgi:hypothetical protein
LDINVIVHGIQTALVYFPMYVAISILLYQFVYPVAMPN